jgi:hypothetical protein
VISISSLPVISISSTPSFSSSPFLTPGECSCEINIDGSIGYRVTKRQSEWRSDEERKIKKFNWILKQSEINYYRVLTMKTRQRPNEWRSDRKGSDDDECVNLIGYQRCRCIVRYDTIHVSLLRIATIQPIRQSSDSKKRYTSLTLGIVTYRNVSYDSYRESYDTEIIALN